MTTGLPGKSAVFRNPNAAPVFRTWVRSSSPRMTGRLSWRPSSSTTSSFVIWSAMTTRAIRGHSKRRSTSTRDSRRRLTTRLARRAHRRSDRRVLLAPGSDEMRGTYRQQRSHFTPVARSATNRGASPSTRCEPDIRDDEQRRQIRLVPAKPFVVLAPRLDGEPCAERGADHLGLSLPLDLDVRLVAQRQQPLPVLHQRRRQRALRASPHPGTAPCAPMLAVARAAPSTAARP